MERTAQSTTTSAPPGIEHVEIKVALEHNLPKGHLPKAGHYLTFRYVLGNRDGTYDRKERGEVVYMWEVRFGYVRKRDFAESNTEGDSGRTAVIKNEVLKRMERLYFDPAYFPMARISNAWGTRGSSSSMTLVCHFPASRPAASSRSMRRRRLGHA